MIAYIGSSRASTRDLLDEQGQETLRKSLRIVDVVGLPAVPAERLNDCRAIQNALADLDLDLTVEQVHVLWAKHARRHGVDWIAPEREVSVALRITAEAMLKDFLLLLEEKNMLVEAVKDWGDA